MTHNYDAAINPRPTVITDKIPRTIWCEFENEAEREAIVMLCHDVDVIVVPREGSVH